MQTRRHDGERAGGVSIGPDARTVGAHPIVRTLPMVAPAGAHTWGACMAATGDRDTPRTITDATGAGVLAAGEGDATIDAHGIYTCDGYDVGMVLCDSTNTTDAAKPTKTRTGGVAMVWVRAGGRFDGTQRTLRGRWHLASTQQPKLRGDAFRVAVAGEHGGVHIDHVEPPEIARRADAVLACRP